ncbi:hypothetical protein L227DRAFT_646228 [Lentinus tigrinus ALCF2SS1-6]|uniref:Zn(2)-C6 fungal-type domain-containing protein n=1 Tax=Lentinus tigrinus ALCF2SS1-6 TaxID=1328759 RepID=A0A5C2RNV9_9APHY|nr:hypothetical protein L227DRAFT_646228 [Lentinus tigrinus ALCF2SS1-6]
MSSPEREDPPTVLTEQVKGKKKQRACDYCRRKKSNAAEMPDHRCSRCIGQGIECTYEPINTRPPSKSYVQVLENRLQNMEKLFEELHPNVQIPKDLGDVPDASRLRTSTSMSHLSRNNTRHSTHSNELTSAVTPPPPDSPLVDSDELEPSDDELEARRNIFESLMRVPLITHPSLARYHGKSSNILFLQTVVDMKQKFAGSEIERPRSAEPILRDLGTISSRRAEYGPVSTAAATTPKPLPYRDFPPPDLMKELVNAYFTHYNLFVPVLHRPTMEQGIKDGLHFREQGFGAVLLLVCANGSRVVDDPRVLTDDGRVAGWKWFEQIETARWSYLETPRLEDLQTCALISMYFWGSNITHSSWTVVGLGLRMAQDMGAHRKKMYKTVPTVKDELMKRAFWALTILDRIYSFGTGRPCAIHDEDVDAEPLLEVDDEYWIHSDPSQAFKQPEGKPSYVAYANCLVRLLKILTFACRTIYSINKSKLMLGMVGPEWEQKIVAELDSSINKWVDLVPPHLKWDPDREDRVFFDQSATLYAYYYLLQIAIHRPFMSARKPSQLTLPSLVICTNAARSCTHVIGVQMKRTGTALILNRIPLFTAGLVLLLNYWGKKRSGQSDPSMLADLHNCMNVLKQLENQVFTDRVIRGVLNDLISMGEAVPARTSELSSSGQLDPLNGTFADDAVPSDVLQSSFLPMPPPEQSNTDQSMLSHLNNLPTPSSQIADSQAQGGYAIRNPSSPPIYSEQLGRIPFHHGFSPLFSPVNGIGTSLQRFPPPFDILTATPPEAGPSTLPQDGPPSREAAIDIAGLDVNAPEFSMRVEDFSELLSTLNVPPSLIAQQPPAPQQAGSASIPMSMDSDPDVLMMSAENMAFAGNMMEMWSTAPTSFDWADWEPYLANMTGADQNNPFDDPPGPAPTSGF